MQIRKYQPGEERELWLLFFHTIRNVNIQHYTPEQVCAWAPDAIDEENWAARIAGIDPWVCVCDRQIVGYTGLVISESEASGYVDHFYVHHQWQRRGVGGRLFAVIEDEAISRKLTQLTADVSISAKPFFESRGFHVVAKQEVAIGCVVFNNFKMMKPLRKPSEARVIREYQQRDLEDLLTTWGTATRLAHPFLTEEFLASERENIPNIYLPLAETWVCEIDGRVVGFIALIGNEVGAIFVQPHHHGKGLGRALMDKARELRDELDVDVFTDNKIGREFYEKCGFEFVEARTHEPTGCEVMRLHLRAAKPNSP